MLPKQPKDIKILIVDDEPDFCSALAFSFKRLGYDVTTAANGNEAFAAIKAGPVDVVISDVRMPDGDGVELLDRVKTQHPAMPIVLLITGFADLTVEEAHNKGAEALFCKPFDRKELVDTITRLLTPAEERWKTQSDRVDVDLLGELRVQGMANTVEAKVVSLGRGGMFVTVPPERCPNVNASVSFKVIFEGSVKPIEGCGLVRWARTRNAPGSPAGCGIEFTYLTEAEREEVVKYVSTRMPKAFIPNR